MDLEEAKVERATISMIQSMVEHRLLGAGYITIAKHYISYRLQRDLEEVVMEITSLFTCTLNKSAKIRNEVTNVASFFMAKWEASFKMKIL